MRRNNITFTTTTSNPQPLVFSPDADAAVAVGRQRERTFGALSKRVRMAAGAIRRDQLVLVLLFALAAALLLCDHTMQLDALRKMAGGGKDAPKSAFGDAQDYLDSLRDALIPLALPLGAIGLTGGGVAYMMGNVMAQKILGGVVIGLALTLMAPTLVN